MANEEQLSILKQGVRTWNKWKQQNPQAKLDLSEADLRGTNLDEVNLVEADLREVQLSEANLSRAKLGKSSLSGAMLNGAKLYAATLILADLTQANLSQADLSQAQLGTVNFGGANLSGATLRDITARRVNLWKTNLLGSKWAAADIGNMIFANSDLSQATELEKVSHSGPSSIATDTFVLSKGNIPGVFLRGCGLSDWEIESVKLYDPDLTNEERNKILYKIYDLEASQAIQLSPLFISYSHTDSMFVDKIGKCLQDKGIRYWRDTHEMKAGRIETQIDRGIRQNPTVLLVMSHHSLSSDWVEHEVRTARQLEKDMGRDVLCPVSLDNSWKSSRWPRRVMEQITEYNILDFSEWKDDVKFEGMFRKLIDGLELFYKG